MRKPFQDLRIVRLLERHCYVVNGPVLRIYFQLSESPPLGWSYMFTLNWQTITYPAKAPAGIENGILWIECPSEQVKMHHLPELEIAVERTNTAYRASLEQNAGAQQKQRALNREARTQLSALAASLNPDPGPPPSRFRAAWQGICRFVGRTFRFPQGNP